MLLHRIPLLLFAILALHGSLTRGEECECDLFSPSSVYYSNFFLSASMASRPLYPHATLGFQHIPKAGGTSVIQFLRTFSLTYFAEGVEQWHRFAFDADYDAWRSLSYQQQKAVRIAEGVWFMRGEQPPLSQGNATALALHSVLSPLAVFTVLREPIALLVSEYNYVHYATWEKSYIPPDKRVPFMQYAQMRAQQHVFLGTSHLVKSDLIRPYLLERFAVLGLLERFDETYKLLACAYGWPSEGSFPKENSGNPTKLVSLGEISDEDMKALNELYARDVQLYNVVKEIFEEQLEALKGNEHTICNNAT